MTGPPRRIINHIKHLSENRSHQAASCTRKTSRNWRLRPFCRRASAAGRGRVAYRDGVRGASVDVQGGGVVVGDSSSGQRGWGGEADRVAAVWETCKRNEHFNLHLWQFHTLLSGIPSFMGAKKSNMWCKNACCIALNTNFDLFNFRSLFFSLHYSPLWLTSNNYKVVYTHNQSFWSRNILSDTKKAKLIYCHSVSSASFGTEGDYCF